MKKIIKIGFFTLVLLVSESCENGFDELNINKTLAPSIDPALVLNDAIVNASPVEGLNYELPIVQQIFSSNTGVLEGGNFNKVNVGSTPNNWNRYYGNVIRYSSDVIAKTSSDDSRANLYHMARIVQAYAFMVITETYGDVPYSEAGAGIFFPVYESQASLYPKIISELKDASTALDASKKIETSDALFNGNIAKWKKFGFSLLLRAGMHISKADATAGSTAVNAAVSGGVILVNADNVIVKHDGNYTNQIGVTLTGTEAANFYLGKPFVDFLQSTSDPRLSSIAVRYPDAKSGTDQSNQITAGTGSKTAANQYGMPVGSTDATADAAAVALFGAGNNRYSFSQADRSKIVRPTAPTFIVTAGQTNLLLAEAAMKGIIGGGSAQAAIYFQNGVSEHMRQMASYDASVAISETAISDYFLIAANNLQAGTELKQIGEQYWVASFLNGYEAWSNFRRTGFPALTPNPFSGESDVVGKFIMRLTYPPNEKNVNKENCLQAIQAQCGCADDLLSTKMWLFK